MALSGFPDEILIKFGVFWDDTQGNGLGPNGDYGHTAGEMVLSKVSGQNKWSESGSAVPNNTDNRIVMTFNGGTLGTYEGSSVTAYIGSTFHRAIAGQKFSPGRGTVYTFRNIFLSTQVGQTFANTLTLVTSPSYPSWAPTTNPGTFGVGGSLYNVKTFEKLEEYVPSEGRAPDKSTYHYG